MADTPLILTLELDPDAQAFFDDLRARHFPPERNHLAAHLTLFHHLPGADIARIEEDLRAVGGREAALSLAVTGLRPLGRGVAFVLESEPLTALRADLAARWRGWLTPQDRQPFRPHVTVQNKVDPAEARALLAALRAGFAPFAAESRALALWHYRGGPWEAAGRFPFAT